MNLVKIILPALIISLFGCEGKEGPVGPSGVVLSGNIIGRVYVYESESIMASSQIVQIQLEGTEYSTFSDSTGKWMLKGVKTGTYNIVCSKEGFSDDKYFGFQFVGGDKPTSGGGYELYKLPTRYVSSITSPVLINGTITIQGNLSTPVTENGAQTVFTYFSRDSIAASIVSNNLSYAYNFVLASSTFAIKIDTSTIYSHLKLKSGTILYFVSHTVSSTNAGYYDFEHGYVLTGLSIKPSNVVSYIIP